MVDSVETWGLPVALDLFFAGVGAGSFCLSVLTGRKKGRGFDVCARSGALIAPFSLAFGLAMLVLDLMYKTHFWFTLCVFNSDSPMSVGVWLLTLFTLLSLAHTFFWLPEGFRTRVPVIGQWSVWQKAAHRRRLGLLGLPVALAVSVYTGVLLSASSLPIWRNLALPGLFCLSSLATGFAAGGLLAFRLASLETIEQPILWLRTGYRIVLPVYLGFALLFTAFAYFYTSWSVVRHLITGEIGVMWWGGVLGVGVLVPLALVMGRGRMNQRRLSVALYALLAGGFLLRIVLIYAGQAFASPVLTTHRF